MKILILNWRDQKNPKGGGAEKLTEIAAQNFVKAGHAVTLFTSAFPGCRSEEQVKGIKIIRRGKIYTVHIEAYKWYKNITKDGRKFDLVIDEINTIPFFTPWYVKEPKIAYINQLAREVWWYEAPFPISFLGYLLEPVYLKIYKKLPTITISPSSKDDLIKLGFKKRNIHIVYAGLDIIPIKNVTLAKKEKIPTLLYFGAIRPMKRVDQIIESIYFIKQEIPNIKLWIAGSGQNKFVKKIKNLVRKLKLDRNVKFWGKVNENQKKKLMKKSHLILVTSAREGWGMIVIEANACGTPAVVYDVAGLRDSVQHRKTGLVCKENKPETLAKNSIKLLKNKNQYKKLQLNALTRSKEFSWPKTANDFLKTVEKIVKK